MLQDDPVNAGGGPGPAREHPHLPPLITPYSQLGTPVEPRPWWAPLGWLLVTLSSLLLLALFLALTPVLLPYVVGRRLWARRLRYHRRPEDLRIAVVGAGWAGLQCLDRFRALGVEQVDVFERYGEVGGTWGPHLRYHGLQIHGSMTVTSFDGFPYSDDPDVMAGKVMAEEVERYIHRFADARDLLPHCRFDANVEALSCSTADRTASLSLSNPKTGDTWTEGPYDLVVWASMAAHWRMPELPGSDRFRGRQVHTTHYSDGAFEDIVEQGRHVVVVGGDKAACDVVLGLRRAGYEDFEWVMRKPYLFYKFERMLHDGSSPVDKLVGLSYLATVLWTGLSKRVGAVLHWSSGYLWTMGRPHRDFTHFHGGVLDATQRKDLQDVAHITGDPVRLTEDSLVLADGREVRADLVIWATGQRQRHRHARARQGRRPLLAAPGRQALQPLRGPGPAGPGLLDGAVDDVRADARDQRGGPRRLPPVRARAAHRAPDAAGGGPSDEREQHPALVHLGAGRLLAAAVGPLPRRPAAAGHHAPGRLPEARAGDLRPGQGDAAALRPPAAARRAGRARCRRRRSCRGRPRPPARLRA
jgi:cation diffusion facilitator CzcD-associated flavoprotein CzcO